MPQLETHKEDTTWDTFSSAFTAARKGGADIKTARSHALMTVVNDGQLTAIDENMRRNNEHQVRKEEARELGQAYRGNVEYLLSPGEQAHELAPDAQKGEISPEQSKAMMAMIREKLEDTTFNGHFYNRIMARYGAISEASMTANEFEEFKQGLTTAADIKNGENVALTMWLQRITNDKTDARQAREITSDYLMSGLFSDLTGDRTIN